MINGVCLSKSDAVTIAAIESGVPVLVDARYLIDVFQVMIRTKAARPAPA